MCHKEYIHYGHPKFDHNAFDPIRNGNFETKPYGGLWASDVNADYGWKQYCVEMGLIFTNFNDSFKFTLRENARLLTVKSDDDLTKIKTTSTHEQPIINTGLGLCEIPRIVIDFEKLASEYDAIECYISKNRDLYYTLYGWDCDSILIMNKDIVIPI